MLKLWSEGHKYVVNIWFKMKGFYNIYYQFLICIQNRSVFLRISENNVQSHYKYGGWIQIMSQYKVITRSHFSVSLVRNSGPHPPGYTACCSSPGSPRRCRSCRPPVRWSLMFEWRCSENKNHKIFSPENLFFSSLLKSML